MHASKNKLLSIVFPNLNGNYEELTTLLTSIKKSSLPQSQLEVIMVDNGSTNKSDEFVKEKFPFVRIIKLNKNYGFSKPVNLAVKNAKGEIITVTNDDIKFEKNCLKNMTKYLLRHKNVGVVGCKVYSAQQPKKVVSSALSYNFYTGHFKNSKNPNQIQKADWVAGCAISLPKKIWEKLKGFDESFFFSSEELDLCLRTKYLGYNVIYLPNAIVWHGKSTTFNRPEYLKIFKNQIYRNKIRLILKHATRLQAVSALTFQMFSSIYNSFAYKNDSFLLYFRAVFWNLQNLPQNISSQRKNT